MLSKTNVRKFQGFQPIGDALHAVVQTLHIFRRIVRV